MMLQYGVEPDVANEQGLRPIDLAARRGQDACERLLAEYHMHHACTQVSARKSHEGHMNSYEVDSPIRTDSDPLDALTA